MHQTVTVTVYDDMTKRGRVVSFTQSPFGALRSTFGPASSPIASFSHIWGRSVQKKAMYRWSMGQVHETLVRIQEEDHGIRPLEKTVCNKMSDPDTQD